jgi:ABC-type antimicrobial peptide transport system permease subunit
LGALIALVWVQGLGTSLPGMPFRFPTSATIAIALAAIALGIVAAILRAQRAARPDPIQAIGYE